MLLTASYVACRQRSRSVASVALRGLIRTLCVACYTVITPVQNRDPCEEA